MSDYEEVRRNPWPLRIFIVLAFFVVAGGSAAHLGMFKHKDTQAEIAAKSSYADWQRRMDDALSVKKQVDRLHVKRTILTGSHQGTDSSTWSTDKGKLDAIDEAIMNKSALYNAKAKDFNNRWAIENHPFSTDASLPGGLPEGERRVLRELPLIL